MKINLLFKMSVLCLVSVFFINSCRKDEEKNRYIAYNMDCFDTVITVTGYEKSREDFDKVADDIFSTLSEYHKLYTIYHRYDGLVNLCAINEASKKENQTFFVDKRISDLLMFAKQMYCYTDGNVNVAMGSVLSLWHGYRTLGASNPKEAALPPAYMLKEADLHTDIEKLVIDEKNGTITISDPLMKLDVGAIAKGYAVEMTARALREKGIEGYVINAGGNVRTIGVKPDGNPWLVGIENPEGGEYVEYLLLKGESVVTSGSYQRYYFVDGKKYHHIISPDTLMPAEGYLSVSVLCKDSGMGDALSTALFCMDMDEGMSLVESSYDTEAMWIDDKGRKTVSSGWSKYVK